MFRYYLYLFNYVHLKSVHYVTPSYIKELPVI